MQNVIASKQPETPSYPTDFYITNGEAQQSIGTQTRTSAHE
jgi:hypothetical protein